MFQCSLAVAIIMIDGSEKRNRQLGFEIQSSCVIENRNNILIFNHLSRRVGPAWNRHGYHIVLTLIIRLSGVIMILG